MAIPVPITWARFRDKTIGPPTVQKFHFCSLEDGFEPPPFGYEYG